MIARQVEEDLLRSVARRPRPRTQLRHRPIDKAAWLTHDNQSGDDGSWRSLLTPEEALGDEDLRRDWEALAHLVHPLNRATLRLPSDEHQCRIKPVFGNRVAVIRDDEGATVWICPIVMWHLTMSLHIRKRVVTRIKVKAATIASGEPLVPADPALFRLLFDGLLEGLPWADCIYINSTFVNTFTSDFIYQGRHRGGHFFVYPSQLKPREWVYHELGESREQFLAEKKGPTRYQLRRRVKKLREHGEGDLQCIRIETEDQVNEHYESALAVADQSWQNDRLGRPLEETVLYRENLLGLARLGILRSYLLKCGGRPCSFVIGYQVNDVLYVEQTAYAREFANLSPGSVLYYLILEDIHTCRKPRFVNHGVGVTPHKRLFTNRAGQDTSIYLFRPTVRNRIRCASHSLFYAGLYRAKQLLARPGPAPLSECE